MKKDKDKGLQNDGKNEAFIFRSSAAGKGAWINDNYFSRNMIKEEIFLKLFLATPKSPCKKNLSVFIDSHNLIVSVSKKAIDDYLLRKPLFSQSSQRMQSFVKKNQKPPL